jgi:hypothetical protein
MDIIREITIGLLFAVIVIALFKIVLMHLRLITLVLLIITASILIYKLSLGLTFMQ